MCVLLWQIKSFSPCIYLYFQSSWDFYLLFLVPEHPYADEHLNILKRIIERGQRRKFIIFDKETILQKVCVTLLAHKIS